MHMRNFLIFSAIVIVFFLLFIVKGVVFLDSDFGWHIRMGQLILKQGIPRTDPFAYTMPSFIYIDPEWLMDIGIAWLYPVVGMLGLSIIFATFGITTFVLQFYRKYNTWTPVLLLLAFASVFSLFGVRMQVISWLFFSLLIWLLSCQSKNKIVRYMPIPLFFIWTNLHGGFPLGLIYLFIFYATHRLQTKTFSWEELFIWILSVAVTFVNPYGYMLWHEQWVIFTDHSLRFSIVEWMPTIMFLRVSMWMYIVISITLFIRYHKRLSLQQKALYIIILIPGLSSYRHIPLWIIASILPTLQTSSYFCEEVKKYKGGLRRQDIFLKILFILALFISIWEISTTFIWRTQNMGSFTYPEQAINFIKKDLPKGNIFTTYEWGGYLDWKLPEKKVFIDGRMACARQEDPPAGESANIFREYQKAMYGTRKDFYRTMKKYNVEILILPKPEEYKKNILDKTFENFFYKFAQSPKPKENKFADFTIIYQDQNSIVYKIKENN